MVADLDHQLRFPVEITATFLWPDIVLWFIPVKTVIMVELTIPCIEGLEAAFERKKEWYTELAAAFSQGRWRGLTFPVEVGCRGYIGVSTQRLLKSLGITDREKRGHAFIDLTKEAERGSF